MLGDLDELYRRIGADRIKMYESIAGRLLTELKECQELMLMSDFEIDLVIVSFNELLKRDRRQESKVRSEKPNVG